MSVKVSVGILSWNHEKYLEKCLLSVKNQTFTDLEIIYLDNHSEDNSRQLAENILQTFHIPVKILHNDSPCRVGQNCNKIYQQSTGKYFTFLSADDWLENENIYKKVELMESNPELGVVYSSGFFYYEETNEFERMETKLFKRGYIYDDLLMDNFVNAIGALVNSDAIGKVGGYDEELNVEDWDMWLRIAACNYQFDFIDEPLVYYRRHSKNITKNPEVLFDSYSTILQKHKEHKLFDAAMRKALKNYAIGIINANSLYKKKKIFQLLKYCFNDISFRKGFKIYLKERRQNNLFL